MPAVKFIEGSQTDIEGLLLPFGGPFNGQDLAGTHFSKSTDFCLDWFGERPLLYHHGLDADAGTAVVGRIKAIEVKDDLGGWMQAQLDASSKYFEAVKKLIEKGVLGLSSGSMAHLITTNAKSGEIKRWPVVEGSLTPAPCNPIATVDFAAAKAHLKAIGIELPAAAKMMGDEPMAGSYEELIEDLTELLNPMTPFGRDCWTCVVATFPDHVIARRRDYEGDETTYWNVAYTVDANGEPTLGTATQVEPAFVPAQESEPTMPLALQAAYIGKSAAALLERTKGLQERRAKESRAISAGIRGQMSANADSLEETARGLRALVTSSAPQSAKAAALRRQADILALESALYGAHN